MRLVLVLLLAMGMFSTVGCISSRGGVVGEAASPLRVESSLTLSDQENAGVIAEITIRNRSEVSLCIPARFLGLLAWPFVVRDESGRDVPPMREMDVDTFGGFSEAFYLVGPAKSLTRKLYLRGHVDLPAGAAFHFEWAGRAYDCEKVANVAGSYDEVEKLPAVSLQAKAMLPR